MTSRRPLLVGLSALALSACTSSKRLAALNINIIDVDEPWASHYSARSSEPFPVPGVDLRRIPKQFWRQEVAYQSKYGPGTIVVDTSERFLYLVQPGGTAMRYGVGVGREESLNFRGTATIGRKAAWPSWTPTANMIQKQPERYADYAGGMPGGLNNPLGARALYLYRNGNDFFFIVKGTIEIYTIGQSVSSGCIRLMNQDIIDLYNRVPTGTKVVVTS